MKKLGKLTLNEMQDFVPLSQEEQIAMKGGATSPYQLFRMALLAWEVAGSISEYLWGSGSSSSEGSQISKVSIHGSDSTIVDPKTGMIKAYYSDSTVVYFE